MTKNGCLVVFHNVERLFNPIKNQSKEIRLFYRMLRYTRVQFKSRGNQQNSGGNLNRHKLGFDLATLKCATSTIVGLFNSSFLYPLRMVSHTMYSDDDDSQEEQYVNYKQKYRELKKNLRYLIYENECFQDELRKAQHNFVSISRDKSFLLDRILKYEKPQGASSDSEATESSDEDDETKNASSSSHFFSQRKKITKRKRSEAEVHNGSSTNPSSEPMHVHAKQFPLKPVSCKGNVIMKKPKRPPTIRKPSVKKEKEVSKTPNDVGRNMINSQVVKNYDINNVQVVNEEQVDSAEQELRNSIARVEFGFSPIPGSDGHMTREEVERHLESRRFSPELNTTATVPAELFSHEPDPESEFEDGEICEFIQLEEDGTSADMILE